MKPVVLFQYKRINLYKRYSGLFGAISHKRLVTYSVQGKVDSNKSFSESRFSSSVAVSSGVQGTVLGPTLFPNASVSPSTMRLFADNCIVSTDVCKT